MSNESIQTSFVIVRLEGTGVAFAVDAGFVALGMSSKFIRKGSASRSGIITDEDYISLEYASLAEAIQSIQNLVASVEIQHIQFVVHFPANPQGNWGFSREEIAEIAALGADLAVTALS